MVRRDPPSPHGPDAATRTSRGVRRDAGTEPDRRPAEPLKAARWLQARIGNRATQRVLRADADGARSGTAEVQRAGIVAGKWVSDGEIHHEKLAAEFYPTWGFVSRLDDRGGWTNPADGRMKLIDPAWRTPWNAYDALWTQASQVHNYANVNKTLYGAAHEFESFAAGTALHNQRLAVIAAGGLLSRGQDGPGPIPMVDHHDEVAVDQFIARALAAYAAWLPNPTLTDRGPSDGGQLTPSQLIRLQARHSYGPGWTFHPSDTGGFSLHHPGPLGAPTFIYHTQNTH